MDSLPHFLPSLESFGHAGYVFIFVVALLESIVFTGFFFPGAVIAVIMGGLAAHGYYNFGLLVGLTFLATVLGDCISYELGRRNHHLLDRWPRFKRPIEATKAFLHSHSHSGVFLGRFFGWTRPIMPFVAGVISMPRWRFYTADTVTCFLWSFVHLGLGYIFGAAWKAALMWSTRALLFIVVICLIIAAFLYVWRWIIRKGRPYILAGVNRLRTYGDHILASPFGKRHPRWANWFVDRFGLTKFTGLPLTVMIFTIGLTTLLLAAVAEDVITGEPITIMDIHVVTLAYLVRTRALLVICYGLSLLVTTRMVVTSALFLSLLFIVQKRWADLMTFLIALCSSSFIVFISKLVFHRPRPVGLLPAVSMTTYSFPSGHATMGIVFYGFLAYLVLRSKSSWAIKVSSVMAALCLATLIGFSRVFLGIHYPSDVLAGALLGFASLLTAVSISEWWHLRQKTTPFPHVIPTIITLLIGQAVFITILLHVSPPQWKPSIVPPEQTIAIPENNPVKLLEDSILHRTSDSLLGRKQFPINFFVLSPEPCLGAAFVQAGMSESNQYTIGGIRAITRAALFQRSFPAALVAPSFYANEPQDISLLQRISTGTTLQVRLWKTAYGNDAERLFAGSATIQTQGRLFFRRRTTTADSALDRLVGAVKQKIAKVKIQNYTLPPLAENRSDRRLIPSDGEISVITIPECPRIAEPAKIAPPPPSTQPGPLPVPLVKP